MLVVKVLFAFLLSSLVVRGIWGYSVSGNKILDPNGNVVLLRGVDRCSFEWSATGQYISLADFTLMKGWGANVVRLSTNQDFWLSTAANYNSGYAANIKQAITWITGLGMGAIIDLHWSDEGDLADTGPAQQAMADVDSVTFWSQVAGNFSNNPWVMFELYNEPYVTDWPTWLNGGTDAGFTSVGMQQLYNAVRGAGAANLVIAGGINYAFDLSGVANYPIVGVNIAYATHPYDYSGKQPANWDAAFGYLAATYPVIATEFGQYCTSDTYVQQLLAYLTTKGIHWTAWAWWVQDCTFPSIVSDWDGTPLAPVGPLVQAALATPATLATAATTVTSATTAKATTSTTTTAKATTSTSTTTTAKATTSTTTTTAATTKSATTAATTAATTKSATTAATTSTTKSATTSGSTTGSTTSTITVTLTVNGGTNTWWLEIETITFSVTVTGTITTVQLLDSVSGDSWITGTTGDPGWIFEPSHAFTAPFSIKVTLSTGVVITATNIITTIAGGTFSGLGTY